MKMKQAVVMGYWRKNLGDDLMLEAFQQLVPDTELILFVDQPFVKAYQKTNLKVIGYNQWTKLINHILLSLGLPGLFFLLFVNKKRDFYLVGGSVFAQHHRWKHQYHSLRYAIDHSARSYIVGSNFGPYTTDDFFSRYEALFERTNRMSFRDHHSISQFSGKSNVEYLPDIVLSLALETKVKPGSMVLVNVIDLESRPALTHLKQSYDEKMTTLIGSLVGQGRKVCLFSFCAYEKDDVAAKRIHASLPRQVQQHVTVYNHSNTMESLRLINEASLIIASRFHAMILAIKAQIPFFILSYNEKIDHVVQDFGYQEYSMTIEEFVQNEEPGWLARILSLRPQSFTEDAALRKAYVRLVNLNQN